MKQPHEAQAAAMDRAGELSDDEIDAIWEALPECRTIANYDDQRRFARAILAAARGDHHGL